MLVDLESRLVFMKCISMLIQLCCWKYVITVCHSCAGLSVVFSYLAFAQGQSCAGNLR